MSARLSAPAAVLLAGLSAAAGSMPDHARAQGADRPPSQPGAAQQPKKEEEDSRVPKSRRQEVPFPQGVTWTAVNVNGRTAEATRRPSFILDANFRMRGFGGCNTFAATAYPLRNQALAVGPMALTKIACDKGVMDFERDFLVSLRGAQNWALEEGRLVLKGQRGTLTFERAL